jgi:hypothetical protein
MGIHSGKAKVSNRRSLEGVKDFVAANPARAVFLKELDGFRCGHGGESAIGIAEGHAIKDASGGLQVAG